ncbi:MAG: hypothetical protein ACTHQE_06230, partial [Thermomicrobiales bacterium]
EVLHPVDPTAPATPPTTVSPPHPTQPAQSATHAPTHPAETPAPTETAATQPTQAVTETPTPATTTTPVVTATPAAPVVEQPVQAPIDYTNAPVQGPEASASGTSLNDLLTQIRDTIEVQVAGSAMRASEAASAPQDGVLLAIDETGTMHASPSPSIASGGSPFGPSVPLGAQVDAASAPLTSSGSGSAGGAGSSGLTGGALTIPLALDLESGASGTAFSLQIPSSITQSIPVPPG